MIRLSLAALGLAVLAACAVSGPDAPGGGTCDAAGAQFAIGASYDADLAERARQASGSRIARRIEPGRAYTLEFSDQRLNLVTDAAGNITEARCG